MWMFEEAGMVWISFREGDVFTIDLSDRRAYRMLFAPVADNTNGRLEIRSYHKDKRGRLWLASNAGAIALLPTDPRLSLVDPPGHIPSSIMFMHQDTAGHILLGTRGSGVFRRDAYTKQWQRITQRDFQPGSRMYRSQNTVLAISPLDAEHYLAATLYGPTIFRAGDDEMKSWPIDVPWTQARGLVAGCTCPDGRTWLASMSFGIIEVDVGNRRVLRHFSQGDSIHHLPAYTVCYMHCTADGTVWAAVHGEHGLLRLRPNDPHFAPPFPQPELAVADLNNLLIRGTHTVLASSNGSGAVVIDLERAVLTRIGVADGLPSPKVAAMVSNSRHGTWIGSPFGLARLGPDGRQAVIADIRMQGDHHSGLLLMDSLSNTLWIGDGTRLLTLDLQGPAPTREAPPVVLQAVRLNGRRMKPQQLDAPLAENDRLVLEISVQDPLLAPRTRVAYRLLPDTIWEHCIGCAEIVFGELPSGRHQLQLRALDATGHWGKPEMVLALAVAPNFWNSWPGRLLMLLVPVFIAMVYFRLRLFKRTADLRAQYERERILAEERLRIASDLHDELGSGLSLIKVRSELALDQPKADAARDMMRQVAASSKDLIHAMRQMIWTIRSGQSRTSDLVAYMRGHSVSFLEDHGINCTFRTEPMAVDRELSTEQRRGILLIMKEALHNVVKHAQAGTVYISITADDHFVMCIADDGVGLQEPQGETPDGGIGLASMYRRAEELGGTIRILVNNGTQVELRLPLATHGTNVP
jgi:signal transduction histidine kinase